MRIMQWNDRAIILSARAYGETGAVVQIFTPSQGRHGGLVRGRKAKPILQPGNLVEAVWNARLSEHLGNLQVELVSPHAARVMMDSERLAALTCACALIETSMPERDPHPALYRTFERFLEVLASGAPWGQAYVTLELELLSELGFALDLSECAATGATQDLAYVSPKSGRAVSREAGAAYHDRLFALPAFLTTPDEIATRTEIGQALKLSSYFLERHWEHVAHKPLPAARARLVAVFNAALRPELA